MTAPGKKTRLLIMDACVLIDYLKTDRTVLQLVSRYVGPVHVASPVVEEILDIDGPEEFLEMDIAIVEPEIEDAYAASQGAGAVSFQDRLCMLTAKRFGMTCVTNDMNLRRLCNAERIPLLWGLELLAELCEAGGIPRFDAENVAQAIHEVNPRHITPAILKRFKERIARV